MAQITVDTTTTHARSAHESGRPDVDVEEDRGERLRSAGPVAVAVALLFGVVMAGALALRDVLDLGVWLLSGS